MQEHAEESCYPPRARLAKKLARTGTGTLPSTPPTKLQFKGVLRIDHDSKAKTFAELAAEAQASGLRPGPRTARTNSEERRAVLMRHPWARVVDVHHCECLRCGKMVKDKRGEYRLAKWNKHQQTCPGILRDKPVGGRRQRGCEASSSCPDTAQAPRRSLRGTTEAKRRAS
ncbi:hypothetical protein B0H15DRAFT_62495 [Mycena belliarum]|uniref:Uncharacterized protein n=1 Tax=Mycena belliarum TaxID=1033014 RepID=A0AAD6TQ99_9AGAR|nr:hypothetical protein B0H15DRAFT_62495 [Mycena belliae]